MGVYGYAQVQCEFNTIDQKAIYKFFKELKEEVSISHEEEMNGYFEIHSDRLQNLDYQCEEVCKIAKKHDCIEEISFSAYSEYDIGHYYNKEEC